MENELVLRKLKTKDIFPISRILKKIGISQHLKQLASGIKAEKNAADEKAAQMKVGIEMLTIVFENLHLAEKDVNDLLADLVGMKPEDFAELEIGDFLKVIVKLKDQEGISDFLQSASK
ncbi:hypothetical protein [Cohnella lupini]|uniref:Uncharacterized protein n=1 Tax=Cohnella lupini TaxID=1294267 RepID=A0A3D9HZ73_9BACL|nr:hypothetical protein [Cohnella lupini]RED54797.1 hypothetical protein DFP95_12153 [Cohnella lupini]